MMKTLIRVQSQTAIAVTFFCRTNLSVDLSSEQGPNANRRNPDALRVPLIGIAQFGHAPASSFCPHRRRHQKDWCARKNKIPKRKFWASKPSI
ncbi:hypothetical protein Rcae01_00048 [Novipirellula caenicola]|uniref:Secreted protein n=1 Tax=Novipirellula caenicola TaxID=1536901 RepID=A0ABP9VHB9_9BACT